MDPSLNSPPERSDARSFEALIRRMGHRKAQPGEWDKIKPDMTRALRPEPKSQDEAECMWLNAALDHMGTNAGWPAATMELHRGCPIRDLLAVDGWTRPAPRVPDYKIAACFEALGGEGGWLALAGHESGTGKTVLAYLLALRELHQWAKVKATETQEWTGACWDELPDHRYIEWPRALQEESSRFRSPSLGSYIDRIGAADLLILDDIEGGGPVWQKGKLENLLAVRYGQKLRTILVVRAACDTAVEAIIGDKSYSRLSERGMVVECNWESYR